MNCSNRMWCGRKKQNSLKMADKTKCEEPNLIKHTDERSGVSESISVSVLLITDEGTVTL